MITGFPPFIEVVIGSGWTGNVPFLENEVIVVQQNAGDPNQYSEDGTLTPNVVNNRLNISFYDYFNGPGSSWNSAYISVLTTGNAYFTFVAAFFLNVTGSDPYTFLDVFNAPPSQMYQPGYGYFDANYLLAPYGNPSTQYYNPLVFKSMEAYLPRVQGYQILKLPQGQHRQFKINTMVSSITHRHRVPTGFGIQPRVLRKSSLGTTIHQKRKNGLGHYRKLSHRQNYGTWLNGLQKVVNRLSQDPIQGFQFLAVDIEEQTSITLRQAIKIVLDDLATLYPTVNYDILLDENSIKHQVTVAQIMQSENSVHNSFSLKGTDPSLFFNADPNQNTTTARIQFKMNNETFLFLLEERKGNALEFELWGRSPSALLDHPFSSEITYSLNSPQKASVIASQLASSVAVSWQIPDWVLPTTFQFQGVPIKGILKIILEIGAVLRSQKDGSLMIRRKHPIRPVNLNTASVHVNYSPQTHVIQLSATREKAQGYNSVEVLGRVIDAEIPQLELESSPNGIPIKGETVYIRSYWGTPDPPQVSFYATDGLVTLVSGQSTQSNKELIEFKEGVGLVSKPVANLKNFRWLGKNGGAIIHQKFKRELLINAHEFRVAEVEYDTVFRRYRLSGHQTELLIFALVVSSPSDVTVKIKMREGDVPSPPINRPLLTDPSIAVEAGKSFLDANFYNPRLITLEAPFDENAKDGNRLHLEDGHLGIQGNAQIQDVTTIFDGPKVTQQITAKQWEL